MLEFDLLGQTIYNMGYLAVTIGIQLRLLDKAVSVDKVTSAYWVSLAEKKLNWCKEMYGMVCLKYDKLPEEIKNRTEIIEAKKTLDDKMELLYI